MVGPRVRPARGPTQDAHRGGAFPGPLVDAGQCHFELRRRGQTNYRAVQAVARAGIGELGVGRSGVDTDAQVDVAFAYLEQVSASVELAHDGMRVFAPDHDVGGVLDQRVGFEAAAARANAQHPGGTQCLEQGAQARLVCVFGASAGAHDGESPCCNTNVYRHLRCPANKYRERRQGL